MQTWGGSPLSNQTKFQITLNRGGKGGGNWAWQQMTNNFNFISCSWRFCITTFLSALRGEEKKVAWWRWADLVLSSHVLCTHMFWVHLYAPTSYQHVFKPPLHTNTSLHPHFIPTCLYAPTSYQHIFMPPLHTNTSLRPHFIPTRL